MVKRTKDGPITAFLFVGVVRAQNSRFSVKRVFFFSSIVVGGHLVAIV